VSRIINRDAANVLFNVATILELAEDNPYRVRAYRRAARLLLQNREDVRLKLTPEQELDLPGLGPRLRKKLGELLSTGHMRFYVELCADLPQEVQNLMQIPGVGPKTAYRLHEELGLSTPLDVYVAAQQGKIQELYGFGPRRERQLLEGAAQVLTGKAKTLAPIPPAAEDELPPADHPPLAIVKPQNGAIQQRLPEAA